LQKAVAEAQGTTPVAVAEATTPVAAVDRLQAVDLQAVATPTAVRAAMSPRAMTTADPKLTKERLTIAATIGFRRAIMAATMNEQLHATTMTPMVIVTTVMDISFTVCGSGMAPPMLITTAIG
jgi:hypothetical protein